MINNDFTERKWNQEVFITRMSTGGKMEVVDVYDGKEVPVSFYVSAGNEVTMCYIMDGKRHVEIGEQAILKMLGPDMYEKLTSKNVKYTKGYKSEEDQKIVGQMEKVIGRFNSEVQKQLDSGEELDNACENTCWKLMLELEEKGEISQENSEPTEPSIMSELRSQVNPVGVINDIPDKNSVNDPNIDIDEI